jgi:Nickel responsive protein SCO4226-like
MTLTGTYPRRMSPFAGRRREMSELHAERAGLLDAPPRRAGAWVRPFGTVFCLSTGPSKEAVRRVHERAGHPADEIYELPVEV